MTRRSGMLTMLTLSESWFVTHTSSRVRGCTDTGSRPTGISATRNGDAGTDRSNTLSRPPIVSATNNRVPSAESRMGWTGPLS
jgi:hypothetical protein